MLTVTSISKSFGNVLAVNEVSFAVKPGEIFGFLGRNGAGKTTTLRMVTGILQPDSGAISVDGIDLLRNPQAAKAITGYIPDRPYLYPKLNAVEFLEFCAELYGMEASSVQDEIKQLLEYYSLWEKRDALIDGYSHGMKQRLATCAALIHKPKLLIVDEPMVGLDVHGARLLKQSLRRYAEEGMAIVLSTHTLHVAEELCKTIAIIDEGALRVIGDLATIKQAAGRDGSLEELFLELTSESDVLE